MSQVSDAERVGSIKSRLGGAGKRVWLKKDNTTVELHDSCTFSTSGMVASCTLTFFGSSQASRISAKPGNLKATIFKDANVKAAKPHGAIAGVCIRGVWERVCVNVPSAIYGSGSIRNRLLTL